MKIAIVHCYPIHYKHILFEAMKEQGLDFEVLFLASGSPVRHEKIPLFEELYRFRIGFDAAYEGLSKYSRGTWIWRSLDDIKPRLILVSGYHSAESWSTWLWALVHRVPLVMWYESNEFDLPRHWPKESLKRLFLKGLTGAQVYGTSSKAYLVRLGLRCQDVITKGAVVNVHKFDTKASEKRYRLDGIVRLIYVGRLAEEKNLFTLVRAFAAAVQEAKSPLRLTIAGTGPCEAALRSEIAELGVTALIEFKGYVYQNDLAGLYRQADFFVLPSTYEPWGLVALEAMLCRLPVLISTQCGCAADAVTSETGWSFSPWNQCQLSSLIRDLADLDEKRIEAMGAAANQLAASYSPEHCAATISASIQHIKKRSRRIGSPPNKSNSEGVNPRPEKPSLRTVRTIEHRTE